MRIKQGVVNMLTIVRYLRPMSRDAYYSVMVDYCVAQAKHYCNLRDNKRAAYWSKQATSYLLKRLELLQKFMES